MCAQLFCFDAASGYCVAYRPAAEGSPCGDGQVYSHLTILWHYHQFGWISVWSDSNLCDPRFEDSQFPNKCYVHGSRDRRFTVPSKAYLMLTMESKRRASAWWRSHQYKIEKYIPLIFARVTIIINYKCSLPSISLILAPTMDYFCEHQQCDIFHVGIVFLFSFPVLYKRAVYNRTRKYNPRLFTTYAELRSSRNEPVLR